MSEKQILTSTGRFDQLILLVRGQRVMLDRDLAALYAVPTKALKQAVKRNRKRFPEDFMFVLSREEFGEWRSQFVTSKAATIHAATLRSQTVTSKKDPRGGPQYPPMAFTEQGVAMLSSVLNSPRAVQVNIEIMRAFVRLREVLASNRELARKFTELERHVAAHDEQIQAIFEAIRQLLNPPEPPRKQIGFQVKERRAAYRAR